MVIAAVMVLVSLVAVMHYQQGIARQSIMRSMAELQFRQAARFAEAKRLGKTTEDPPPDARLSASLAEVTAKGSVALSPQEARKVWSDLSDLSIQPDSQLTAPGTSDIELTPKSVDSSLLVFGKHRYEMQHSKGQGYALYAPKGKIKAGQVMGWANPRHDDKRKSLESFSGVPAVVAGLNEVELEKLDYGSAYSKKGKATIESGLGVAFAGYFPYLDYDTTLTSKIETSFGALQGVAHDTDKTNLITGDILDIGKSIAMFFSGSGSLSLTLQQAMEFPFPPIPGFSQDVPGLLYEFWVCLPEPPDFSENSTAKDEDSKAFTDKLTAASDEYKAAKAQVEALQAQLAAESDADKKKDIQEKLDKANQRFDAAKQTLKDLQEEAEGNSKKNKDRINNNGIAPYTPQTRNDDLAITGKNGQTGWPYRALLSNLLDLLLNIISGDTDGILNLFFKKVRLVHFGGKNNTPDFTFNGGLFHSTATWTVPPGRSFCYRGNMEIAGDLWLQRGTTFLVEGDLTVASPGAGSGLNPLSPSGRVFLEEGSSLLVTGNFSCEGSPLYGSVMIGSRAGVAHPLNSAILCKGNVNIPYSMMTAMTLEDTVRWLGDKEPAIGKLNQVITPLLSLIAPNAAKLAGPFHMRKCYFASYAATFQLIIIPIVEVPVPTPIPIPHKNALVPVFKALTRLYTITMNFSLGENLYPSADWWIFGEGVVPMIPKLDLPRALDAIKGLSLPSFSLDGFDWESKLKEFAEDLGKEAAAKIVTTVITKVVTKIVASAAIPFGGSIVDILVDELLDQIQAQIDEALDAGNFMDTLKNDALDLLKSKLKTVLDQVLTEGLLRENAGCVVYAGGTMDIGYLNGAPTTDVIASGLFISRGNVRMNADHAIGQIVSLEGDIEAKKVLYNPYFTRASLYVPKSSESDWVKRAFELNYGKDYDSGQSTEIEPDLSDIITSRGWR